MDAWEAEKRSRHQRNVAIIIVVFSGLLYLSYKFDDDPPFRRRAPPVSQPSPTPLSPTPMGLVVLDRIAVDRLVINRGTALPIEIGWHRIDGRPGQIQPLVQLVSTQTGEVAVSMGPVSIRSGNNQLQIGVPSRMPPGDYQVTVTMPGDGDAPFYRAAGPTVSVI
jgi:hypothetical protein